MERSLDVVKEIMLYFARATGLEGGGPSRRYLWTDAFAVCNYLELYRQTGEQRWRELAMRLIDEVHHVLGRHRPDSDRSGWIGGMSEEEGEHHPTRGGLRIGKALNERKPDEFPDERLEWERDGQYYHYLTKWMHALTCANRITGEIDPLRWAVELAQSAHSAFSYQPVTEEGKRLYWKMSIDLSRPEALSMGQHDPLDGLVTCCELKAATASSDVGLPPLTGEIQDLREMCRGRDWDTDDTLGVGSLLSDAYRMVQLTAEGAFDDLHLLEEVLESARFGLNAINSEGQFDISARFRLAFRELGLSIGLKGILPMADLAEEKAALFGSRYPAIRERLELLKGYLPMADRIERFWLDPLNQETGTWNDHREISMVMLATSLAPQVFLSLRNRVGKVEARQEE
ncbi:hypothetical protein GMSM_14310 [Geomonas sp. Red276]